MGVYISSKVGLVFAYTHIYYATQVYKYVEINIFTDKNELEVTHHRRPKRCQSSNFGFANKKQHRPDTCEMNDRGGIICSDM